MSTQISPQVLITPDNLTPVVQILTWFLLITSFLGYLTRAGTKIALGRALTVDDYLITVSMLFSIGQSVAVSIQTLNGLGKPLRASTVQELHTDLKSAYAADILYSLGLAFSKFTVLGLIWKISPSVHSIRRVYIVGAIVGAWTVTSIFVIVFQCDLSHPWNVVENKCISLTGWWTFFEAMNLVTDVMLVALPYPIICKLKADLSRRVSILSFFTARLVVIAAIICKIVYLNIYTYTDDWSLNMWSVVVCTQVIQCLSLLGACMLYMKPFLDSLQPGWMRSDDFRRRGLSDQWQKYTSDDSTVTDSSVPSRPPSRRASTASKIAGGMRFFLR